MFNVGDRVEIIGRCHGDLVQYKGTIQEIASVEDGEYRMKGLPKYTPKGYGCYWFKHELKLAKEEQVMFKVGQKVTVVEYVTPEQKNYMGKTGEVVRLDYDGDPYVKFADGKTVFFTKKRLKLVQEEQKMEPKAIAKMLKEGTKVKIIGMERVYGKELIGCTGVVSEVRSEERQCYLVKIDNPPTGFELHHDDCWYVCESDVEEVKTLDCKEALKLAIDGHKVRSTKYMHKNAHVIFEVDKFMFVNKSGRKKEMCSAIKDYTGTPWEIYVEQPKPKFTIGQSVVYKGNRMATVVDVKESGDTFVYTLMSNPEFPKSTFEKTEEELKEAK